MKSLSIAIVILSTLLSTANATQKEEQFQNDGIWEWLKAPIEVAIKDRASTGEKPDERTRSTFLCVVENEKVSPQILTIENAIPLVVCGVANTTNVRLVGFDEEKKRIQSGSGGSASYPGARVEVTEMKLGVGKLKYLGIEQLTSEKQRLQAKEAQTKLNTDGITVSYPAEGETFPYRLPNPKGESLSSEGNLGHVVVIQWWASW